MGIEKEREAFENLWLAGGGNFDNFIFSEDQGKYAAIENSNLTDKQKEMALYVVNNAYLFFVGGFKQAAKAQAVPEGFVLVKNVHPDAIVHNQGLGLFKECQIIYGWDGKSKDFKDALNKGFYHGVKLGAKAVLETTMIEAQEPTND
ncbi:MAG: hypothetical protein J5965_20615 [Aeriscardovia sp.]|nr:hypothetical protein [Aeriscardovia sp.]